MNAPLADLQVRVTGRSTVGDVVVLDLTPVAGAPAWSPGDHVDVLLPDGVVRQYSLCGAAADRWRLAVLRETAGRGGSAWIADSVREGDLLSLAGPRSTFAYLPDPATPAVFLAGGIGITPLAPMARAARDAGVDYTLHYAGHEGQMAFVDELRAEHGDRLVTHVSEQARLDLPAFIASIAAGTAVYCCGPLRLIDAAQDLALARGLDFHAERFEAEPLTAPVWDGDFEVELTMTGVTVTVPPDRSILEVAEENGVFVLSSCQEGTCGTCETVVLDGEVDHRDSILTPAERERGDRMFICVSRAACPRLVLDL